MNMDDEVGGETCRGENTRSDRGLVEWSCIVFGVGLVVLQWFEMDHGQGVEHDSWSLVCNHASLAVPSRSIHEQAVDIDSILCSFSDLLSLLGLQKLETE